jgi:uncharacterized protein involved in cysteine biosynthesis
MQDVLAAFAGAARRLLEPRIVALVLLPPLGSVLLWSVLGWLFWGAWTGAVAAAMASSTTVAGWLEGWSAGRVIDYTAAFVVLVAMLPAVYVTALVITEIFAMPLIVRLVAERDHPGLERAAGGSVAGSILNAAAGIAVFALLWILTLPLWLTGVGAVLAPLLTSAYLLQRLLRYDALAEHASREEYDRLLRTSRGDLFLLGFLLSLLLYVPLVNLLVPVLSGLAFAHFCLARLARLRATA